jgi:chitinase
VVGYYEGWGARRPCNAFFPEQIPRGVYSIINFAFATIDPQTFEVLPATPEDIPLYKRLTALKKDDPTLRIYIAIGGWTFNDPGPTATVFSDIARSEANQKKFIKSLIAFLNKYDMDGVDLDWEYPEAPDRSGRPEDFKNFPKFMENLSKELQQTAGRGGLSITLPASFWYLQHFDLVKLKKSVDFFNIMSYDLHGTWDKGTNLHSI